MNIRDAVNEILLSLNELPLDIEDAIEDIGIAVIVDKELTIARKKILARGWYFNTITMELVPNAENYIPIPLSFLSLDGGEAEPDLTVRDWKLFDKAELSFLFEDNKEVEVIEDLPFDDIPFSVANFIVATASLSSYINIIGNSEDINIRRLALNDAKIEAIRDDANNQDGNLLTDTHSTGLLDRTAL